MKTSRSGLHDMLYYGEAVGVLLAWVVGVAVVLATSAGSQPSAGEAERLANAASVESNAAAQ